MSIYTSSYLEKKRPLYVTIRNQVCPLTDNMNHSSCYPLLLDHLKQYRDIRRITDPPSLPACHSMSPAGPLSFATQAELRAAGMFSLFYLRLDHGFKTALEFCCGLHFPQTDMRQVPDLGDLPPIPLVNYQEINISRHTIVSSEIT